MAEASEADWGLDQAERRLTGAGFSPQGEAFKSLHMLRGLALTEAQANQVWYLVCSVLEEQTGLVREGCIRAIQGLAGIPGRN